jgi:hypothetical protein
MIQERVREKKRDLDDKVDKGGEEKGSKRGKRLLQKRSEM